MSDFSDKDKKLLMNALDTSGVFITVGKEQPNVMSTHWGSIGRFWNKNIFCLPVRPNKLTHKLIDETKCFAVSVPVRDMSNELSLCDHLSGYYTNKFEELHLLPKSAINIPTYTLSECGLILECKVIFSFDITKDKLDEEIFNDNYEDKEFHTIYLSEIIDSYYND